MEQKVFSCQQHDVYKTEKHIIGQEFVEPIAYICSPGCQFTVQTILNNTQCLSFTNKQMFAGLIRLADYWIIIKHLLFFVFFFFFLPAVAI